MSYRRAIFLLSFVLLFYPKLINAESEKDIYEQRLQLYKKTEAVTNIPWYFLAAVDQYERNTLTDTSDEPLISITIRSEEHTSELQSRGHLVCRLLLEKKK